METIALKISFLKSDMLHKLFIPVNKNMLQRDSGNQFICTFLLVVMKKWDLLLEVI